MKVDLVTTDRPLTPLERGAPRLDICARSSGRRGVDNKTCPTIWSQTGNSGAPETTDDQPCSGGSSWELHNIIGVRGRVLGQHHLPYLAAADAGSDAAKRRRRGRFPSSTFVGAPYLRNRQARDSFGCPEGVTAERLQVDLSAEQSGRQPLDNAPLPRGDGIEPRPGGQPTSPV